MKHFSELPLDDKLLRAIKDAGYTTPTPIQAQAIPHLLEGRDLLGCARTGTGKTAAFALPILQRLSHQPHGGVRTLVLVPTRELASQVAESFADYGSHLDLSVTVIYGGVSQGAQVRALKAGVDILVATPGRLVDLMNQGHVKLDRVQVLVLDEADHMLDLGFIPDVRRIIAKLPVKRQTLLFSATMPPAIAELANKLLTDPAKVMVTPPASTVELVDQSVHHVASVEKSELLARLLLQPEVESALVFTRTKRGADRVAKRLLSAGIKALAIHGNKAQAVRERSLKSFRDGGTRVLVATDVAARGIDVDGISHVFNYELPHVPETYVHRIGRTGRAGAGGVAIALCAEDERALLKDIEKLTKRHIRVVPQHEVAKLPQVTWTSMPTEAPYRDPRQSAQRGSRGPAGRGGRPAPASQGRASSRGGGRPQAGRGQRASAKPWAPSAEAVRGSRVETLRGVKQDAGQRTASREDARAPAARSESRPAARPESRPAARQESRREPQAAPRAASSHRPSREPARAMAPDLRRRPERDERRTDAPRSTREARPAKPATASRSQEAPRPKPASKPFHRPSAPPRLAEDSAVLRRRARHAGSPDGRE